MSGSPPRVLHIVDHLGLGGAQTGMVNTLARLREQGYEPLVLALHKPGWGADRLIEGGIPVYDLGASALTLPLGLGAVVARARKLRLSLVHAQLCISCAVGARVARRLGLPLVVHVRNIVAAEAYAQRWCLARGLRAASAVVCVSDAVAASVRTLAPDLEAPVTTIHNPLDWAALNAATPVDARAEWGLGADEQVVVFAGRLVPQKGLDVLLLAWKRLVATRRARLLILGDGYLRSRLEAQARDLGLADSVILAGYRPDAIQIARTCDVFVMPSRFEGLSMAVLEALAVGMPVVATPVGGMPEVIEEGVSGLFAPPGNPAALAAALARVLDDASLRRTLSDGASSCIERSFSPEQAVRDLADLYDRLLAVAPESSLVG